MKLLGVRVGDLKALLEEHGIFVKHVHDLVDVHLVDHVAGHDVPSVFVGILLLDHGHVEAGLPGKSVYLRGISGVVGKHGEVVVIVGASESCLEPRHPPFSPMVLDYFAHALKDVGIGEGNQFKAIVRILVHSIVSVPGRNEERLGITRGLTSNTSVS